jgi:hypothetical protein
MSRFFFASVLVSLSAVALGESGPNAAPQGPGAQGPQRPSSAVQIWDDRVFDLGEKAAPPDRRKSASGTERYLGPEADYNTGQRDRWLGACESVKSDLREYRRCIEAEKLKSRETLQQNRAEVEGRSSLPLRNVPSPLYDSEAQRNPAYDVQIERLEEKN